MREQLQKKPASVGNRAPDDRRSDERTCPASGASGDMLFRLPAKTTSDSSAEVCAPLSWTSERVDTLFVDEPVRKAAAHSANRASGASETKTARAAPSKRAARM